MINQSILLALLLSPPPSSPHEIDAPDFADQLDHVDVTVSDDDAVVVAFDEAGEAIASLSIWVDARGVTWLATDYADGYSLVSVDPITDEVTREGDLDDAVLADRYEALLDYLDDPAAPWEKKGKDKGAKPNHTWKKCAFYAVKGGVACALVSPFGCVWGGVKMACACVPKVVKEFEEYSCPLGL